jgi:hypothetical protein
MKAYAGKCYGGPYDGNLWACPKKTMPVLWEYGREGNYKFDDGIWVWNGPSRTPQQQRATGE